MFPPIFIKIMIEDDSDLRARKAVRGRGTGELAKGRFERLETAYEQTEAAQVETQVFKDTSRSVISYNDSPDVGFSASLNPYRGCEHGCIYCYARPTHEYLGLSAGLDFETKLFAKLEAPELLRAELQKKSWQPQTLVISGVTDCYQPIERKLELTRNCLKVLAEFRNPIAIITKNYLVTRDIDILKTLAEYEAAQVVVSITTLDAELARTMEPRASTPTLRLKTVEELAKAGIPVSVNMAPIIPGLTDHEIPALLKAAAAAGARSAHYTMVRLPHGVKDLFQTWLEEHYPNHKQKVLNRIKDVRGGKLYSAQFGSRMRGEGVYAEHIAQMFASCRERYGLNKKSTPLSTQHFCRQADAQLSLL
jgi:DNA repair photolyase